MTESGPEVIYCVDTSSLITIQRTYPLTVFSGLWQRLSQLAYSGRLAAPREVYRELERGGDDEIFGWAKSHNFVFKDLDSEQLEIVRQIVNDRTFQGLFDMQKETPDADPFVIALAVVEQSRQKMSPERWIVVSDEARIDQAKGTRIPTVCRDPRYNLECIRTLEVFKRERWEFA